MPSNVLRLNNQLSSTGTFNTITAGNSVAMSTVNMTGVQFGTLSAECTTLGETNTITLTPKWQVSRDGGSTWLDVAPNPVNGAYTIQSTGTAGGDVAVTKVIQAPDAVYGFPLARLAVTVGVVTGGASDTYTTAYSWVKPAFI
jgi:hypothetical protein